MSRLLQALKNLEARSPPPAAAKGLLAHLADKHRDPSPDPPPTSTESTSDVGKPTPIPPLPIDGPLAYLSVGVPTILLPATPPDVAEKIPVAPSAPPAPPPLRREIARPAPEKTTPQRSGKIVAPTSPAAVAPPVVEEVVESPAASPTRQATMLERIVRRVLADPERSQPLRQLADRLLTDLGQITGRSLLITGIGSASETHEVVLEAAAVLAEAGEPILIIDGDTVGRALTRKLELADGWGLAELARGEEPAEDPIRALAFDHLSLLPIGQARLSDPGASGNRLSSLIQSLESSFRLVLIDGGRVGESAAALARMCDAAYFVVRLGHTDASDAQSALRDFRSAGARVLGCIATS
jgi:Mrp family chromosome partitioning ATPase